MSNKSIQARFSVKKSLFYDLFGIQWIRPKIRFAKHPYYSRAIRSISSVIDYARNLSKVTAAILEIKKPVQDQRIVLE